MNEKKILVELEKVEIEAILNAFEILAITSWEQDFSEMTKDEMYNFGYVCGSLVDLLSKAIAE